MAYGWRSLRGNPVSSDSELASSSSGVNTKYLYFTKSEVSSAWKDLAFHLGFQEQDVNNYEGRNWDDKSRCFDMLMEWQKRRGDSATIHTLLKALRDAELQYIVDGLKNKYPELNEVPEPVASGLTGRVETKGPRHESVRKYFFFIKEKVSSDWRDLAYFLGFQTSDIDAIEGTNRDDKSRCFDMLMEWQKRRGDSATIHTLLKALRDAELQYIVDGLKKKNTELLLVNEVPEPVASELTGRVETNFEGWIDWNGTLATLTVENLLCFKERRTVDLQKETTAIIGPNSSGKTTLFRGLQLFATLSYEMSSTSSGNQLISNSIITDIFLLSDIKDFWHRRDTEKPVIISGKDTDGNELQFIINYVTGGTVVRVDKETNEESSRIVGQAHRPVLAVLDIVNSDAYKPQVPVRVSVPSFPVVRLDHSQVFSMLCELQHDKAYWDLLRAMLKSVQPGCVIRLISGIRQRGQKEIMVREESHDIPLQKFDSGLLQIVAVLVFVLHSLKCFCPIKPDSGDRPMATVLLDNIGRFLGGDTFSNLLKCLTRTINCQTVVTTSSIEVALECQNIIPIQGPSSSHHFGSPLIPKMEIFSGDTAKALISMGNAFKNLGDFRQAISYIERSLQMMMRIHGESTAHPDIAESLDNLGGIWSDLGDHRKALSYYEQALQVMQRIHVKETAQPDIARLLAKLGKAWGELGDVGKAGNYKQQSQQMYLTIYSQNMAHSDLPCRSESPSL